MKCEYCGHESEARDKVLLWEQGVKHKLVPICEDIDRCLERQLANPPKRTEKKILAGVR